MKGGVYQDKRRGSWHVWFPAKGKRLLLSHYTDGQPLSSKKMADVLLAKLNADVHGRDFHPEKYTRVHSLIFERAWETYQRTKVVSPQRMKDRERICRDWFLPHFKGKVITEITKHDINDWYSRIPVKGANYRRIIVATLAAFFHAYDIFMKFPRVSIPKPVVRWMNKEQQDRVLEFVPKIHQGIMRFILCYGCRVSEPCKLRRSHIDWQKREITLTDRKARDNNTLPILDEIEPYLRSGRITNLDYVFCRRSGAAYDRYAVYGIWKRAILQAHEKYGVPVMSLTCGGRKSRACQLLNQGIDSALVARVLGNTQAVVEKHYGRFSTEKISEALSANRLQKEASPKEALTIKG